MKPLATPTRFHVERMQEEGANRSQEQDIRIQWDTHPVIREDYDLTTSKAATQPLKAATWSR
jgi:hypothetical protein